MGKYMWSKAKLLKYFLVCIAAFLPLLAFADGSGSLSSSLSLHLFTPPGTDYSLAFIRHLFGTNFLGHVTTLTGSASELISTNQTIIGTIFGIFNAGVISIASLFLIYTTVRSIVDTAQEGEIMGKKLTHWTAIRTALGIGILVPKFSGFSFIQVFVMWSVIQGIGLADNAWNMALDYLQKGGVIYATPATIRQDDTVDVALVDAERNTNVGAANTDKVGAVDVMRSLICMHALNKIIDEKRESKLADIKANPQNYPKPGTQAYDSLMTQLSTSYQLHVQVGHSTESPKMMIPGARMNEQLPDYVKPYFAKGGSLAGICGVYSWNVAAGGTSKDVQDDSQAYSAAKLTGLQQMVTSLDPTAKRAVDKAYAGTLKVPPASGDPGAQALVSSAVGYQSSVYPSRLLAARNDKKRDGMHYQAAKDAGWAMAGSYYYDIAGITDLGNLDTKQYQSKMMQFAPDPDSRVGTGREGSYQALRRFYMSQKMTKYLPQLTSALKWTNGVDAQAYILAQNINSKIKKGDKNVLPTLSDSSAFYGYKDVNLDWEAYSGHNDNLAGVNVNTSMQKVNVNAPELNFRVGSQFYPTEESDNLGYIAGLLYDMKVLNYNAVFQNLQSSVNGVVHAWFVNMVYPQSANLSPIAKLSALGNEMIKQSVNFWQSTLNTILEYGLNFAAVEEGFSVAATLIGSTGTMMGLGTGAAVAFNVASSALALFMKVAASIMLAALPLGIAVTAPMFVLGVTLSVYVPLIPYILFTFGVISWLIFVIEAMAASPLVALGITHPEGHDLMGKSEQAVMLLLSVLLRPVCMIIGLVVGIVLSYVGFSVLNAGFAHIVTSLGLVPPTSPSSIMMTESTVDTGQLIKSMSILVIYTFIAIAIINQCFGLIHVIPEKIMTWIGLHPQTTGDEQRLESVKAGLGQFSEAGARGAGEAAGAHKGLVSMSPQKATVAPLPSPSSGAKAGLGALTSMVGMG